MKIATKVRYENISEQETFPILLPKPIVEEEKDFNIIHVVRDMQKALNKEYNGCIKISNIKFCISPANTSDSIDVALDLNKTSLQNI